MRWKPTRAVVVLAGVVATLAIAVPAASASGPQMVCSRSENPGLTWVHDGYAPYAYLGLDHYGGFDTFVFIGNVVGGGAGKYVQWYFVVGIPTVDSLLGEGPSGETTSWEYYGTKFCPGW
jgi:hypothetical protein